MTVSNASWVGQTLAAGRYRVSALLGAGGMGQVFRARDTRLDAEVVIKVPHRGLLDNPQAAARFRRESRALVRLTHPHIVRILDVGDHEDVPFVVLHFLPGGSLQERLRRGAAESLADWLPPVAAALDYIHAQGYVHRDVKPGNIFFDAAGQPYLGDFGIVRAADEQPTAAHLTGTGELLGTPHYLAPEAAREGRIDGRADQYALAVTVYEWLCGHLPFEGPPAVVVAQHLSQPPPPPSRWVPGLPPAVDVALVRALAKDPAHRFADCQTFARTLLAALPRHALLAATHTAAPPAEQVPTDLRWDCPACRQPYRLRPTVVGKMIVCPNCRTVNQAQPDPPLQVSRPTVAGATAFTEMYDVPAPRAKASRPPEAPRHRAGLAVGGAALGGVLGLVVLGFLLFGGGGETVGGDAEEPGPTSEPTKTAAPLKVLEDEYAEYRQHLRTGRMSVVFLHRTAHLRYADWRPQAEAGNPIAQLFIGRCYQEGLVVKKDEAAAIPWLEKSAAQGNDCAMLTLGLAYEEGRGVEADRSRTVQWYTKAARAGNTPAMRNLGSLYYDGQIGNKPDPKMGFTWYKQAADAGDAVALRVVGNCYRSGTGVEKDPAAADQWSKKATEAGDPTLVGKSLGERLGPHFTAYLAPGATEGQKTAALEALRKLKGEYDQMDLACVAAVFSEANLGLTTTGLKDLKADDPARVFHDELLNRFAKLYAAASRSERAEYASGFSVVTEDLVSQWMKDKQHDKVVAFWEQSYQDVLPLRSNVSGEFNALVHQLDWSVTSLMKTGKRKEAEEVVQGALLLCDRLLKDHPWDWYLKDAYSGLCFDAAAAWVGQGERGKAQPLLRRGWEVRLKQFGKEALLDRYQELPLKGEAPAGATGDDREFFEGFAPGGNKGKGRMSRYTIPCDFDGVQFPFHVYVLSGPRGHAELLDQFRWVTEMRGGEVPARVRNRFLRINEKAVEKKADFRELCLEELANVDWSKE